MTVAGMRVMRAPWRSEMPFLWAFAAGLLVCLILYGAVRLVMEPPAERPYLKVLGASFILNYRVSDIYVGFTADVDRPIPIGSVLEATFPDPAGGPPAIVRERIGVPDRRISMRSPSLSGVKADVPYTVSLRLLDRRTGEPMWSERIEVTSNVDGSVVPSRPLTVGPGYHQPPD